MCAVRILLSHLGGDYVMYRTPNKSQEWRNTVEHSELLIDG